MKINQTMQSTWRPWYSAGATPKIEMEMEILHLLFAGLCDGSDFSALHDYDIMNRVLFYIPHTRWKYRRFITETQDYDYFGSLKIKEGCKKSNVL